MCPLYLFWVNGQHIVTCLVPRDALWHTFVDADNIFDTILGIIVVPSVKKEVLFKYS